MIDDAPTAGFECLSDSDRMLLQAATQAKAQADAIHLFVTAHLGRLYQLEDGTQLEGGTGRILRPQSINSER